METVKDYLDKLEIKNSILAKQLKETYINRVVIHVNKSIKIITKGKKTTFR